MSSNPENSPTVPSVASPAMLTFKGIARYNDAILKKYQYLPSAGKDAPLTIEILTEGEFDRRFSKYGNYSGIYFSRHNPACPTFPHSAYTAIHTDAKGGVVRTFVHEFGHHVQHEELDAQQNKEFIDTARANDRLLPTTYAREPKKNGKYMYWEAFASCYEYYYYYRGLVRWVRKHLHREFRQLLDKYLGIPS